MIVSAAVALFITESGAASVKINELVNKDLEVLAQTDAEFVG